jgi:hypothetical protein
LSEGSHAPASRPVKPAYLIGGGVLALVVIVGLLILLTGGSASPIIGGSKSETPTPGFQFKALKLHAITTGPVTTQNPDAHPDTQKASTAAGPAAADAKAVMHAYYTDAFLAPDNWTQGSYDSAFDGFSPQATNQAQQHLPVLTAGTAAGDTFSSIKPTKATIKTRVLLDGLYRPYSVACTIYFEAAAANKTGGGKVDLVSQGQFILQKVGNAWKVTSFSVRRADQGVPAPSGSASPSASGSPS